MNRKQLLATLVEAAHEKGLKASISGDKVTIVKRDSTLTLAVTPSHNIQVVGTSGNEFAYLEDAELVHLESLIEVM